MNIQIKVVIKKALERILAKFGYQIQPWISISPWNDDDHFNDIRTQVIGHTLVGKIQLYMIYQYAKHVVSLPGDIAEVGVYKGGTARLLAKVFEPTNKTIHLFDTFSGMPPSDPIDIHKEGDFSDTSLESVRAYLDDCQNVRFYQGLFPTTSKPVAENSFCLVHIDVDIYKSAMDCCKFFYQRMEKSGIIIFDDYGLLDCPGVKMAVDEFFSDKLETPCYLTTGQCIVVRL